MWRLALAGLLLTTTALAQEPPVNSAQPGRITGVVVTDGGLPVAGAEVTRHSVADNDFLSTVVSDATTGAGGARTGGRTFATGDADAACGGGGFLETV